MNLSFQQKWPQRMGPELARKPNYFVEKILLGLFRYYPISFVEIRNLYVKNKSRELTSFLEVVALEKEGFHFKPHTIREDKHDRWEEGRDIHFVVNNRTKDRFQFAPVIKCTGTQKIEIRHFEEHKEVIVDNETIVYAWNQVYPNPKMNEIAINDGFPSAEAFFNYFNKDFKGKIIHWTDLKY